MVTQERPTAAQPMSVEGARLGFLGGLHRSGTSLIHRCLSDHSQISGFAGTGVPEDEGQHLQTVYPTAFNFGGPGMFGFRQASHMDEYSPLARPENADRLLQQWLPHWDASRSVLIEKSPPNLVRTRFLQALFPGCRFVVVLRHPVAVAYATQKWVPKGVWVGSLIEHWLICHERFEADRAHLRHVHVLRYEDFVERPQVELDAMLAFLGLNPEPLLQDVKTGVNDGYLARWRGRWRNPLARPYIETVIRRFEDRVQRFGYSLREGLDGQG